MDLGANLFYKCQFDVELVDTSKGDDLLWGILLMFRAWVRSKRYGFLNGMHALTKAKSGMSIRENRDDGLAVLFRSSLYRGEDGVEWAGILEERYPSEKDEESDLTYAPRNWTTELSYRAASLQGPGVFSLILSYRDCPGFLGPTKPAPSFSVPRMVRLLTCDRKLRCSRSDHDLRQMLAQIGVEGGTGILGIPDFWNEVMRDERGYPMVYISRGGADGRPVVDPQTLSDAVYPNALVCVPTDVAADEAIRQQCPVENLECLKGFVRVYAGLPRLRGTDAAGDLRRHRYFSPSYIDRLGGGDSQSPGAALIAILRQALSQDVHLYETRNFVSLDQVRRHRYEADLKKRSTDMDERLHRYRDRLDALRRSVAEQPDDHAGEGDLGAQDVGDDETIRRLEAEVNRRIGGYRRKADEAFELAESYEKDLTGVNHRNKKLGMKICRLNAKIDGLNAQIEGLRQGNVSEDDRDEMRQLLLTADLPDCLKAASDRAKAARQRIVRMFARVYDDRIIVADRAMSGMRDCVTKPALLWQAMAMVCGPLWRAYERGGGNIEDLFRMDGETLAGFDVALSEGRMTARDNGLMNLRRITVNGRDYSIEPHLKKGNRDDDDSIRLYYAWDGDLRKIVIGHIGKHLANYTTRRGVR